MQTEARTPRLRAWLTEFEPALLLAATSLLRDSLLKRGCQPADLVHDVICKALASLDGFRGEEKPQFLAWLKRILNNRFIDLLRERSPMLEHEVQIAVHDSTAMLDGMIAASGTSPSEAAARMELALRLAAAITRLLPSQQEVVSLTVYDHLSINEIAERTAQTPKAVGNLLARGLVALRRHLREYEEGGSHE